MVINLPVVIKLTGSLVKSFVFVNKFMFYLMIGLGWKKKGVEMAPFLQLSTKKLGLF